MNRELYDTARECALRLARHHGKVTLDDVFNELLRMGLDPHQLGPSSGGVFRAREFVFTGKYRRSKCNGARIRQVWKLKEDANENSVAVHSDSCLPTKLR